MIVVGADHNGFSLKEELRTYLERGGYDVIDVGATTKASTDDYPTFAKAVVRRLRRKEEGKGILLCGSGNGMAMVANRYRHVRAAVACNIAAARRARQDEDANILVLPVWWVSSRTAKNITRVFLTTRFSGAARHRRRLSEWQRLGHA